MDELIVGILGFGNVGRALAELILLKRDSLHADHNFAIKVVGISTGSHGYAIDPQGIDLKKALSAVKAGSIDELHRGKPIEATAQWLEQLSANLLFECSPTNPETGQPALDFVRTALEKGMHVVTANKGPVAFGYRELSKLAQDRGLGFFFESTVMDGAPALGIGREALPLSNIHRIRGIFNSTTNFILTRMEEDGLSFEEALQQAQDIGIAETDPTLDIDGWDSAIKTVIMANVLMGGDFRPKDVNPKGIRNLNLEEVRQAESRGKRIRLVCEATRGSDGQLTLRVEPEEVDLTDPMATIKGTTSIVDYEADTLRRLTVIEHDPGPDTTAYGMYADMMNILRGRHNNTLNF